MPGKWPDQTLDQAFGLPEVLVAVSTSRLSCKRAGKTRTLMPVWDSSGESRIKTEDVTDMEDILHRAVGFQNLSIKKAQAHYDTEALFSRRNQHLGVPVIILTSIVATSVFATLAQQQRSTFVTVATGALSIAAAVLSGLQTFLRYSERAAEHRRAAVSYENIRRNFDLFSLQFKEPSDRPAALKELENLSAKLDAIAETAPPIPLEIWKRVKWKTTDETDSETAATHPMPPSKGNQPSA